MKYRKITRKESHCETNKTLSKMSLEELWRLFPIFLTEHQESWEQWYGDELEFLSGLLPGKGVHRITHIGSTAVKRIWAKPIVDILLEIDPDCDMNNVREILTSHGYICMSEEKSRKTFNKGYTENGFAERVYHLHLRYSGDNDELYFRDYLIENPEIAEEYEKVKLDLWRKYEYDRDGYTQQKTEFVKRITRQAKEKYGNRY